MQEFLLDLEDLDFVLSTMKLLGSKGTTGTQASFLELFDGDQETMIKLTQRLHKNWALSNLSCLRTNLFP